MPLIVGGYEYIWAAYLVVAAGILGFIAYDLFVKNSTKKKLEEWRKK